MLVIRLKRTGRKGHAQFRVVVQDSRRHPSSGKVVEYLGSLDPHTKEAKLDKEAVDKYLANGAQPTPRVVRILKSEGVKLPSWVKDEPEKKGKLRNPEKLRKNQPKEEAPVEESPAAEEVSAEAPAEAEAPAKEEAPKEEAPAEAEEKTAEAEKEAEPAA